MKTIWRKSACVLIALSMVFVQGCLDVTTTTHVNRDGSLDREIVYEGDSSSVFRREYPIDLNAGWAITTKKIENGKYRMTATRRFADAREMNTVIHGEKGKTLQIAGSFVKKYGLFFTTIRYSEKYYRYNVFNVLSVDNYLSRDEQAMYLRCILRKDSIRTRGDSLSMHAADERFDEWQARNVFEAYYLIVADGLKKNGASTETLEVLRNQKENLFDKTRHEFSAGENDSQRRSTIRDLFTEVLGPSVSDDVYAAKAHDFDEYFKQKACVEQIAHYPYKLRVAMPGLVTKTNARTVEGNIAKWEDFMMYCYIDDFEIWVESEYVNWWSIIIASFLLFVLPIVYFLVRRRRTAINKQRSRLADAREDRFDAAQP